MSVSVSINDPKRLGNTTHCTRNVALSKGGIVVATWNRRSDNFIRSVALYKEKRGKPKRNNGEDNKQASVTHNSTNTYSAASWMLSPAFSISRPAPSSVSQAAMPRHNVTRASIKNDFENLNILKLLPSFIVVF
jgi:hypothetical protein